MRAPLQFLLALALLAPLGLASAVLWLLVACLIDAWTEDVVRLLQGAP